MRVRDIDMVSLRFLFFKLDVSIVKIWSLALQREQFELLYTVLSLTKPPKPRHIYKVNKKQYENRFCVYTFMQKH